MGKRIFIFGNRNVGVECLDYIHGQGGDIVGVSPESYDDGKDGWQRSFRKRCLELGMNILDAKRINEPAFVAQVAALKPDVLFSFQCARIFKNIMLNAAPMGCINLHFAPLPKYRGCSPIAWMVLNGEKRAGVTLHMVDEGIDTGDIVFQDFFPIAPNMSARELYDLETEKAVALFKKSYAAIMAGGFPKTKQDEAASSYYDKNQMDFKQGGVDWNEHVEILHRKIRMLIFPPLQLPTAKYGGEEFGITAVGDFRLGQACPSKPGDIVGIGDSAITVAAFGGTIRLEGFSHKGENMSPSEFSAKLGLKVGARFD